MKLSALSLALVLTACRHAPVVSTLEPIDLHPAYPMVNITRDLMPEMEIPAAPPVQYQIGAGDVLQITYTFGRKSETQDFVVKPGDQLSISFLETPNYNRTITVRPDGRASLPSVGDIKLADKSIAQIESELRDKYSGFLTEPTLDVQLIGIYSADDALRAAVTSASAGAVREHIVRPDGFISLPLLGDQKAAGLTLAGLVEQLNAGYKAAGIANVLVSASLSKAASSVVYLLGEVQNQGKLPLNGRINLWRLIADAGGFSANADRRHITLMRLNEAGEEQRQVFDFETWRSAEAQSKEDIFIQPGDMVYVPVLTQQFVYVTGEVEVPRQIEIGNDTVMTASQALTISGGVELKGDETRILLLRKTSANEPQIQEIDLKKIFDASQYAAGSHPADPRLVAGDILYVPTSRVGDFNKFAARWFRDGAWTVLPFSAHASYQKGDFNTHSSTNQ